jgi:isopentenyl-diphosphate delta-isomerase type 1
MSGFEPLDIIDKSGKFLGMRKPRSLVHRDGDWHRTVHVWVINHKQEVLFQKRSLQKESFPGVWDVSAAGHISAGETSLQAAIKELAEEIGVYATEQDLTFLNTLVNQSVQHDGAFVDNEFSDVYVLKKEIEVDTLVLQSSEVSEARYFPQDNLRRIAETRDTAFAPHWREYSDLHEYLSKLEE